MTALVESRENRLALVVDDSTIQRKVTTSLLEEIGYRVVTAENGVEAIAMFQQHRPNIVLMDIDMPVMGGYQAAREIKNLSQQTLAPIIFVTSLDSDSAYIDSVEAGGDGILVRPFSSPVFKAKIKAMQRIGDLYSEVKRLQSQQQKDAEIAEQLMSGVIESRNFALDKLGIIRQPAELFSGDIQLSSLCPNGDINIMLGDFTGHGLRSSIGAIPLSETFRAMTKKGFALNQIVSQVNHLLFDLFPPDLFLAATFVTISSHDKSAYIFNAGLPDAYIFAQSGEIKKRISSIHPPLGVLPELLPDTRLSVISIIDSDRLVLISDGIIEAGNESGEMYGYERFEQAARQGVLDGKVSKTVLASVMDYCNNQPQEDDISLIDIPCGGWIQKLTSVPNEYERSAKFEGDVADFGEPSWQWSIHLTSTPLKSINPIPMVMNQINELEGAGEQWQFLYTILTELFINALDHGLLCLSSDLKNSAEGLAYYFNERERRLKHLSEGYIDISLRYHALREGGKMVITIKDSGEGFNVLKVLKNNSEAEASGKALFGRGVELVNQLCDTLEYRENGTLVEATYLWKHTTKL